MSLKATAPLKYRCHLVLVGTYFLLQTHPFVLLEPQGTSSLESSASALGYSSSASSTIGTACYVGRRAGLLLSQAVYVH